MDQNHAPTDPWMLIGNGERMDVLQDLFKRIDKLQSSVDGLTSKVDNITLTTGAIWEIISPPKMVESFNSTSSTSTQNSVLERISANRTKPKDLQRSIDTHEVPDTASSIDTESFISFSSSLSTSQQGIENGYKDESTVSRDDQSNSEVAVSPGKYHETHSTSHVELSHIGFTWTPKVPSSNNDRDTYITDQSPGMASNGPESGEYTRQTADPYQEPEKEQTPQAEHHIRPGSEWQRQPYTLNGNINVMEERDKNQQHQLEGNQHDTGGSLSPEIPSCLETGSSMPNATNRRKTSPNSLNFNLPSLPLRPPSPFPRLENRKKVTASCIKRERTDAVDDNRFSYFVVGAEGDLHDEHNRVPIRGPYEDIPVDTQRQTQHHGHSGLRNNNQIAVSGLKNQHSDVDNRFNEEAHAESAATFYHSRTQRCSNMLLIENGGRKQKETGSQIQIPPNKERARGQHGDQQVVSNANLHRLINEQESEASAAVDIKSNGMDTVICLDTSASMEGTSLKKAKDAIFDLLDGIEQSAADFDLEENVAIVTFGKENKIVQHLTNNYDGVRDSLNTIGEAGGPSPLWLGIALSLTELNTRGGSCYMTHVNIPPRIILISDGFPTRRNVLSSSDVNVVDQEAAVEVLSLVERSRKTVNIDCVTIGSHNMDLLTRLSNRPVHSTADMDYLAQFFRTQDAANTMLARCMNENVTDQDILTFIQPLELHDQAMEEVINIVRRKLSSPSTNMQTGSAPTGAQIGSASTVDQTVPAASVAQTGQSTSVAQTGPATSVAQTGSPTPVSQNDSEPNVVQTGITSNVDLEAGTTSITVRTGFSLTEIVQKSTEDQGQVDLSNKRSATVSPILHTQNRMPDERSATPPVIPASSEENIDDVIAPDFGTQVVANPDWTGWHSRQNLFGTVIGIRKKGQIKVVWTDETIEKVQYGVDGHYDIKVTPGVTYDDGILRVGSTVERGPDWRWKDQDGGVGSVGVALKLDKGGTVVHVIWEHGIQGNYRYGWDKKYDIKISLKSREASVDETPPKDEPVWQIETADDEWETFPTEISKVIEEMNTTKPKGTFIVKSQDKQYRILLMSMQARDLTSNNSYTIQRLESQEGLGNEQ